MFMLIFRYSSYKKSPVKNTNIAFEVIKFGKMIESIDLDNLAERHKDLLVPISLSDHLSFIKYHESDNSVEIPDIIFDSFRHFLDYQIIHHHLSSSARDDDKQRGMNKYMAKDRLNIFAAIQQFEISSNLENVFGIEFCDRIKDIINDKVGDPDNRKCNIWFTPNGSVAEFHMDKYDGILFQIYGGTRLVDLLHPENVIPSDGAVAIPRVFDHQTRKFTKELWNGETYIENFAKKVKYEKDESIILNDGEAIFIPSGKFFLNLIFALL